MLRIFTAFALLLAARVFAEQPATEQDRLIATGKLWTTVKYFHPYLAYRPDIDWDKALVDALPKIRSAKTAAEYVDALNFMLDALHDPLTRIGLSKTNAKSAAVQRTWIHYSLTSSAFSTYAAPGPIDTVTIPVGQGVEAVIRLSEPVTSSVPAFPSPQPDRAYNEAAFPTTEYRILAAYKIWAVFHQFFAYRDLMDEDWDDVFTSFLPKLIAAKEAREYNLSVAEMITHVSDSHAEVRSDELSKYFGEAPVGLRLRLIEKIPVIVRVLDPDASKAGVRPGDIVTNVDEEDIIQRVNREARYISSSTQQALGDSVMRRVLNGPEGSTAALTIRNREGESKQITLKRSQSYRQTLEAEREGDAVRLLPGNIGYADLNRLAPEAVDAMFEKFRDIKAIIFDARGPASPASAIAAHLSKSSDTAGAIFTGPLSLTPDVATTGRLTSTASFFFVEALPPPAASTYKGKTVMLIDERTSGVAEHTGLFLEAANNTAFIGSLSAGADGEITRFVVPGGITISFSSQDVRHANAGKLERVGLEPSEPVSPSLSGIRAGRDEILEHAIQYVSQQ